MDKNCWYAVQVYVGHEASCESHLRWKGYQVFLPRSREPMPARSQICEVRRVLFPGYLFCKITDDSSGMILTTPGCVRVLGAGNEPIAVPDEELDRVKKIVAAPLPAKAWRYLPAGCMVRIESGPLIGLHGILLSERDKRRLVVSLTLLQRSVAVELNEHILLSSLEIPKDRYPESVLHLDVSN